MPNLITHIYFGEEVYKTLPEDLQKRIDLNRDAFVLGSIGPDFLFALRGIGDKAGRYCNNMQYLKTYRTFSAMKDYIERTHDEVALVYALGFICHYVADFNLHAYVNAAIEELLPSDVRPRLVETIHGLTESALDEYVITVGKGFKNSNDYNAGRALKSRRSTRKSIGKMYFCALNRIFGFDVQEYKIGMSFQIMRFLMCATTDKTGMIKKLVDKYEERKGSKKQITSLMRPPEGYGKIDYLNFRRRPFRKVRNEDALIDCDAIELLNAARNQTYSYIEEFLSAVATGEELKKENYEINFEGVRI